MPYQISRVLNTLTISTTDSSEFHQLSILSLVVSSYARLPFPDAGTNVVVLIQGTKKVLLPINTISQIGGVTALTTLAGVKDQIQTLCTGIISVAPVLTSSGHAAKSTTNAYAALDAQPCNQLTIVNDTGVTIEVQQDAGAVGLPVFASSSYTFFGLSNANQLGVRRGDGQTTAVTVKYRWER